MSSEFLARTIPRRSVLTPNITNTWGRFAEPGGRCRETLPPHPPIGSPMRAATARPYGGRPKQAEPNESQCLARKSFPWCLISDMDYCLRISCGERAAKLLELSKILGPPRRVLPFPAHQLTELIPLPDGIRAQRIFD